jgi:hypothetical protein
VTGAGTTGWLETEAGSAGESGVAGAVCPIAGKAVPSNSARLKGSKEPRKADKPGKAGKLASGRMCSVHDAVKSLEKQWQKRITAQ